MAYWIRANPFRKTSETFMCSKCSGTVYQHHKATLNGNCTYRYCPWCKTGMEKGTREGVAEILKEAGLMNETD